MRVHLDSPKLIFPDGPDIVLTLPIGHSTKRVRVEARASGTFTMTVTLESADGSLELGPPTRVTIRSAVFSGIGIALTIGALLFLAGWWGNHFRRTRPERRDASEHSGERSRGRSRPPRPLERGGRDGHAALARHRAPARRGPRLRGRARQPRRHVQPRQLDAQHRLRAPPRRCAVGNPRPALRRAPRSAATPRDRGRLHGRADRAHGADRDRDAVRSAHRAPLRARHLGNRAGRATSRDDDLHALVPAANGVLRPHRARLGAPQRPPPIRRGCVRARAQQPDRDRRARRLRPHDRGITQ